MPNRLLREGILDSEAVNSLDWAAEVFYRRLMSVVDDYGRFDARTAVLRSRLYPLKTDQVREADISRWIAACVKAGLLALYVVDGRQYILFRKFNQQVRAKTSKYPSPPTAGADALHVPVACAADAQHVQRTRQADAEHMRSESESESEAQTESAARDRGGGGVCASAPEPETAVLATPRVDIFTEAWNAAGLMPLKPTSKLRGLWNARWESDPEFRNRWREAISRAGKSPRCRGDRPGFRATPEWFLRDDDAVTRLLDRGEFDDGPAPPPAADPGEAARRTRATLDKLNRSSAGVMKGFDRKERP